MASCSSVQSEEHFMCSICQDEFTEPVTTPCGHNFCKACITKHWDNNNLCQCPLCMKDFTERPELFVNTVLKDVVEKEQKIREQQIPAFPGEVPCDVCTGAKLKALKTCLECVASYCETHLEPHLRIIRLKKHQLIPPVENLEDRMCKKHDIPLEMFCRTDQTCVCPSCTEEDHRNHDTVPLEKEGRRMKTEIKKTKGQVQKMIQERLEKVQEIKLSVGTSQRDAVREISDSVEIFTALIRSTERSQAELLKVNEENQRAAKKQAQGFIRELEQEIADLKKRGADLEQLSQSEDNLHLLQTFPSLSAPPPTKDWSEVSIHSKVSVVEGAVRRAVSQLEDTLNTLNTKMENLREIQLRRIQQYAVDVTLDSDTAHPCLILSEDGKQVRLGDTGKNLPDNPGRFNQCPCVLGKQSVSLGGFYYEVQVKGKTDWDLGMVRESINRKGTIALSPQDGYWTINLRSGDEYTAIADTAVLLSLREKPQKVGVFVNYEEGQVSFYDVGARRHLYSFTGCTFTEKLHPYFSICNNDGGKNSTPLIITPVNPEIPKKPLWKKILLKTKNLR